MAKVEKQRFAGLFKPAWQNSSASKRLAAVSQLDKDDPKDQEILQQLAQDPDDAVSLAAIGLLDDLQILSRLAAALPNPTQQTTARNRFRQVIGDGRMADEQSGIACLNEMPDRAADFAICAPLEPVRMQALTQVASEDWLLILGEARYSDTRQWIVERLETLEDMLSARKLIRGKDKKAERLLKERIDAIHRAEQEREELAASARRLIEEAHYLSTTEGLLDVGSRVTALEKKWSDLEGQVDEGVRERYAQASKAMVERHQAQQELESIAVAQAALLKAIQGTIEEISRLDLDSVRGRGEAIRNQAMTHASAWADLESRHASESADAAHCEQMLAAMHSAADFADLVADSEASKLALKQLKWPRIFGDFRAASELRETQEAERQEQLARESQHQEKLNRVHQQISTIGRLAKAGRLGQARGLCKAVEQELENHQGKEHQHLLERLGAAQESLQQMDDWKDFATEPKYQQLCEAMEKLVGSSKHPDALSGEIRKLQEQWKSLGHTAISDQYWERFKAASDKAFEPCGAFFEQRREIRGGNLEQRETCVVRMRALLDDTDWDEQPDYPGIQRQLGAIFRDFQAIKDVERTAGAEQWERFKEIRNAVQARLAPEYDRNLEAQQQLIGLVKSLADAPAVVDHLDRLKALQARWKQIGITRPSEGRKAWKAFKEQGDRAYENLQSLRQQQREAQNAALDQRRSMVRLIRDLARSAESLSQIDSQFEELQQQFSSLPELPNDTPEKLRKSLDKDYRGACSAIDDSRRRFLARQREDQLVALREKAALCLELEVPDVSDADRAKISEKWEQIELTDSEMARRIESRRQAAAEPRDPDAIARERRLFCIRAEISLELASPDEDRQLRMQYQLEQMNEHGLGHAQGLIARKSIEELEVDWLCMPGAGREIQEQMDERFRRCLAQAQPGSARTSSGR